ncbi:MAG: GNAT family N-acetyltransferase, partial [Planctomycetaceae bacterium]|jgi:CelD/BcsL family acetyltransferase involved in cellulose biosynthesis|nr:GNAT family N-acetyltransferase [Planctomycetaceae bacterium]
MNPEIQILKSPEEFRDIRDEWNVLTDCCVYPNAFLRAEWLLAWWKWFGCKLGTFYVLIIRNRECLIGGLPLFRERNGTLKFLGFDGVTCSEYLGLAVKTEYLEQTAQELAKFFVNQKNWTRFYFEDYAAEDAGTSRFVELLKQHCPSWEQAGEGRYHIPLPDSYDAYLMTRGQNNRYKKRKELKKAIDEFHAHLVEPEYSEIDQWFSELQRLGIAALEHKTLPPMKREDFSGLVYDLITELLPRKEFRIFMLYYGDKPAAFKLGFVHAGKFYDYLTGFDPNLPGRAGNIVIHFILMRLIEEGFREFDFLRGLEDYKTHWTEHLHPTKTIIIFRRYGIAYYKTQFVEKILRSIWRKLKNFRNK